MLEYDPFSPEAMADPHRFYPELRARHPVYRLEAYRGWALSRFDDCWQVLQDHERFSVVEGPVFVQEQLRAPFDASASRAEPGRSFATWDAPEHTRIRRATTSRFSPKSIAAHENEMRRLAEELLDELVPRGGFDVVRDLVGPFGLANVARVLGLEIDDLGSLFVQIQRSNERDPGRPGFREAGMALQGEIHERVRRQVKARRECGATNDASVLAVLMRFEFAGARLSDVDVATQLMTLLLGGAETIPKVIAGGLLELARQPEQWRSLVSDPGLAPAAFEEMMRHQGVLQHVGRTALEDLEIAGQPIRRGDRLFLLLQSANRDEREFPYAEHFDIHRSVSRHLALGLGRHHCIGSHLARLEGRVLLETFVKRIRDFQVIESGLHRPPSEFQVGYNRLPISLEPRP